jgi:hypothetical protein
MMVNKKNRREKGRRALPILSNPHSKGELFSRLKAIFILKIKDKLSTIKTKTNRTKARKAK